MQNKKGIFFSKFRAIRRKNPSKQHANLKFLKCKNDKKIKKDIACGYCLQQLSKRSPDLDNCSIKRLGNYKY